MDSLSVSSFLARTFKMFTIWEGEVYEGVKQSRKTRGGGVKEDFYWHLKGTAQYKCSLYLHYSPLSKSHFQSQVQDFFCATHMTFNKINLPNLPGHFEDLDIAIYIKSGNIDIFSLWKNVLSQNWYLVIRLDFVLLLQIRCRFWLSSQQTFPRVCLVH